MDSTKIFPNTISILWLVICIRISFGASYASTFWFEKVLWGAIIVLFLKTILFNFKFRGDSKKLFYVFSLLVVLMTIGLFFNASSMAFRSIIGVICVFSFLIDIAYSKCEIQIWYLRIFYYFALGMLLLETLRGAELGNSVPGCIVFLTCAYFVAEFYRYKKHKNQHNNDSRCLKRLIMLLCFGTTFWISWNAQSRAASLALVVILLSCFLLFFIKREKGITALFWILVIGTVIATVAYAKISTYSWYDAINEWSLKYFDKNADSSRARLWLESLESLSWWQWVIGKGTGVLPEVKEYETASFHNTYIQLLMQNGLLGLICLIFIFKILWDTLAKHRNDSIVRFVLATFIGVIIYNCFECTLLQNKAFLGIVQWCVISFGVLRCRYLDNMIMKEKENG